MNEQVEYQFMNCKGCGAPSEYKCSYCGTFSLPREGCDSVKVEYINGGIDYFAKQADAFLSCLPKYKKE